MKKNTFANFSDFGATGTWKKPQDKIVAELWLETRKKIHKGAGAFHSAGQSKEG